MNKPGRMASFVVAGVIIVFALVLGAGPILGERGLSGILPSSCIVGLNGAAVSVQLDGQGAGPECDSWAASTVTNGGTWYRYRDGTVPGGAVICQLVRDSITLTVRDAGVLDVYGTGICRNLLATPTP